MTLLKSRPDVELLLPREIIPGREVSAVVVLRCRRQISVDAITVRFKGIEIWPDPQHKFLGLFAELGGRTLEKGETRLPFRFAIPNGNPPSYRGKVATIRYEASVHVDIPWWPDRVARYTIQVGAAPRPDPSDAPQRYSTRPAGPVGTEAHAELSLTSQWARPGDIISGAFALSNTAYNAYGAATLRLASTEVSHFGFRQSVAAQTFASRIEDTRQGEASMIPFRMSVPTMVTPSFDQSRPVGKGLFSLTWEFVLEVEVRRGKNVEMRIPFKILPQDPEASPRSYQAPPLVGSNRTGELWQSVGETHGFAMHGDELRRSLGDVHCAVRREHQGRDGVFLMASFRYPPLGLGLEIERAGRVRRVVGGGVTLQNETFGKSYFVRARDEEQIRASLGEALCAAGSPLTAGQATLYAMDDETCVLRLADNGHSPEVLDAILRDASRALETLQALGGEVTPPTGHAGSLEEWEHLSAGLGAALCVGALSISAQQGSVSIEVTTLFGKDGGPEATRLRVRADTSLDVSPLELSTESREELILDAYQGELAQRLIAAATGGTYFRLDADEILVEFAAPLGFAVSPEPGLLGVAKEIDAASALVRIGHLVRIIGLLSGEAGPYR